MSARIPAWLRRIVDSELDEQQARRIIEESARKADNILAISHPPARSRRTQRAPSQNRRAPRSKR
jgi:hypothetical protein